MDYHELCTFVANLRKQYRKDFNQADIALESLEEAFRREGRALIRNKDKNNVLMLIRQLANNVRASKRGLIDGTN